MKLLRLHEEPFRYFNEIQIHLALMKNTCAFMNYLEEFYRVWQKNKRIVRLPKKQVFTTEGLKGDLRVMPCIIEGFQKQTIKAVKVIGTNEEEQTIQDKISVGKALLVDHADNYVKGIFDVGALSSFRTAAISMLAFKHTINLRKPRVGFIGAGRVGFYSAVILSQWLGIKEVALFDTNTQRSTLFIQALDKMLKIKKDKPASLFRSCNAIFLATTSPEPLLSAKQAKAIQFISSVGADAHNLSELDSDLLGQRQIISESRQNIHFGDLHRWHKAGLLKIKDVQELRDCIGRIPQKEHPVLFISTGTAVQDALICHFLYRYLNHS